MELDPNSYQEYPQISNVQAPENVLKRLVADLSVPIRSIENLLPNLLERNDQNDRKMILSQLAQAVSIINQNNTSVIGYLNSRGRNNISESRNVAEAILAEFTHEIREKAMPLKGYIALCEQGQLSEDRSEYFITLMVNFGESLIEIFKVLEGNWRTWLETKDWGWENPL